jgi:hypothetical protein
LERHAGSRGIPRSKEQACHPARMALLVYDMQAGIVTQLPTGPEIVVRVREVLEAAREGGFPVFFSRHMSLPKELMGTFQLRQQMAWQRVESVHLPSAPPGVQRERLRVRTAVHPTSEKPSSRKSVTASGALARGDQGPRTSRVKTRTAGGTSSCGSKRT